MANKSPSFQFYPRDYLTDVNVAMMTLEEQGVYIRLLCYAWLSNKPGKISREPQAILAITGLDEEGWDRCKNNILRAFDCSNPKYFIQKRLVAEYKKQQIYKNQCVKSGKKGGETTQARLKGGLRMAQATLEPPLSLSTLKPPLSFSTSTSKAAAASSENSKKAGQSALEYAMTCADGKGRSIQPHDQELILNSVTDFTLWKKAVDSWSNCRWVGTAVRKLVDQYLSSKPELTPSQIKSNMTLSKREIEDAIREAEEDG